MSSGSPDKRVIIKLSGEIFGGRGGNGLNGRTLSRLAHEVKEVADLGVEIGLVVGGGNFFRGGRNDLDVIARTTGDDMGMLATVVNALAFRDFLKDLGLNAKVLSALELPKVCDRFSVRAAERQLARKGVLIFAGGTGNPLFTTDSAAALRACELGADLLLKATNVDGVYSKDPNKHADAKRYKRLTYDQCVRRRLQVMDVAAFDLCASHKIPIIVFDVRRRGNIKRAVLGQDIGTIVGG